MRLLLINRALPIHVAGGLERHVEDLARGLAAAGVEVHLLCAPLPPGSMARERRRLAELGLALHEVPAVPPGRYSLAWLRRIGTEIDSVCHAIRPDLVHAEEFAAGWWRPARGAPPLVMTVHGTITSETPLHRDVWPLVPPGQRPGALLRYGRRFMFLPVWHRTLRTARLIMVDSHYTRLELARVAPDVTQKIRHVPLGVPWSRDPAPDRESARAELGWGEPTPRLVTTGRLEWAKGQDLALVALAVQRDLPWHYHIAGDGSRRESLERLIRRLDLGSRVSLVGRLAPDDLRRLLAAADLFIWPERTHPAFGLAGYEAQLVGTPVLAARRGAIPEVLGEGTHQGAWFFDPPLPQRLGEQLRPLLQSPAQLRAAREGLREAALARFSYEGMIARTIEIYREAIEQGTTSA